MKITMVVHDEKNYEKLIQELDSINGVLKINKNKDFDLDKEIITLEIVPSERAIQYLFYYYINCGWSYKSTIRFIASKIKEYYDEC